MSSPPDGDREERKNLTEDKNPPVARVHQSYVNYFLNDDIYSCFPLSLRFKVKLKRVFTCRSQNNFVDDLMLVRLA